MTAKIIDGKAVALKVKQELAVEIKERTDKGMRAPTLCVILVGNNPASEVYVRNKHKDCAEIGIESIKCVLPEQTTESELLSIIDSYNQNDDVDGILVQLPLPKHINERLVTERILPEKDVDAFNPVNAGKNFLGIKAFLPCTPAGVIRLLKEYDISIAGKECVVIGRSNIVGKPMALLLLNENGTVTVCHSRSASLSEITKRADILVVAVGKANFITADMIKDGAVLIDVGMNRYNDKLCGDIDFESCKEKASYITPVPGGVGPMTRAMLMCNTVSAAYSNQK